MLLPKPKNIGLICLYGVVAGILLAAAGYTAYLAVVNQRLDLARYEQTDVHVINFGKGTSKKPSIRSAADLEEFLESKSFLSRSLAIRGLLVNADERTTKELFRISESVGSKASQIEIQSIIVEKLASLNPRDSLEFIDHLQDDRRNPLVEVIFREWARADLDAAVEYAVPILEVDQRAAFAGILASDSVLTDHALDIARQLNTEQMYFDYSATTLLKEPVDDPATAFRSFLSQHGQRIDDFSEIESRYLVHVIQSWIAGSGVDVIHQASQQLNTDSARAEMLSQLYIQEDNNALVLAIFKSMYEMDKDIASRSVEKWAEIEPYSAFKFASDLGDDKTRTRIMRSVVWTWSETNPLSLLDSLNELPENFREGAQTDAMFALAKTSYQHAARKLGEIPDSIAKDSLAHSIAREWGARDIRAALDWVLTDPLEQDLDLQGADLRYSVFRGAFRVDPELALELALEQPLEKEAIGFEASLIAHLASEDAESALAMVHYARNWETLSSSYWSIGKAFIQEGKAERAMEMVKGETEEFQTKFFRWMMFDWAESDAQGMYAGLDSLPTSEIQGLCSVMLLLQHEREAFLTDVQLEKLEGIANRSPENSQ